MQQPAEGCWLLTEAAERDVLKESMWLQTPVRFFSERPEIPVSDWTKMECWQHLENSGWRTQTLSDAARQPYRQGGQRVWYADRHSNFFTKYAKVLLMAPELFRAGVTAIHHGQRDAYYHALMTLPADQKRLVQPDKNAKEYRALLGLEQDLCSRSCRFCVENNSRFAGGEAGPHHAS